MLPVGQATVVRSPMLIWVLPCHSELLYLKESFQQKNMFIIPNIKKDLGIKKLGEIEKAPKLYRIAQAKVIPHAFFYLNLGL